MGTERLRAEDIILYEDKDILVCRKPGGLPVQTRRIGTMDMENMLKKLSGSKGRKNLIWQLFIVWISRSRGILVFGKNQKSGARLSEEMQKNEMEKIYLACVQGVPEKEEGILEDQMEKVPGSNLSRIVENKTKKQQKKLY